MIHKCSFSLDDPNTGDSNTGDHENQFGEFNLTDFNKFHTRYSFMYNDNCRAKYYVVREVLSNQPWYGTMTGDEYNIFFTRLSDPGFPANPTYLKHILKDLGNGRPVIPVEYRLL